MTEDSEQAEPNERQRAADIGFARIWSVADIMRIALVVAVADAASPPPLDRALSNENAQIAGLTISVVSQLLEVLFVALIAIVCTSRPKRNFCVVTTGQSRHDGRPTSPKKKKRIPLSGRISCFKA
ncbi:hypothetical protein BDZ90DRAFT_173029 [Jaminaea rosea]|uniref:Uncharacterized protein n=1 Tax=Jaminaea rosea TaxID=1569628 RepID=A0A316UR91_9BASI|nr:hypothetical protein BDZ90DRAFT_173029 [Jaminaea rosea]PWN27829.1 hypothetical protein BDZ90DRAFT_173029 [Jaminaea rosea]